MTTPPRGLGRGLGALIPSSSAASAQGTPAEGAIPTGMLEVPVADITPNPRQPRTAMDSDCSGRTGRLHPGTWPDPAADRHAGPSHRSRAVPTDCRRATLAGGAAGRPGNRARAGQRSHAATIPGAGSRREHPARRSQPPGRSRSIPGVDQRFRAEPAGCSRPGGQEPGRCGEHRASVAPAGPGQGAVGSGERSAKAMPAPCSAWKTTPRSSGPPSRWWRARLTVRQTEELVRRLARRG